MSVMIPLTNDPNQSFICNIPLGNLNLRLGMALAWNAMAGYWTLGLSDVNGNKLVSNIPLIQASVNLLAQWEYLGIGSAFIIPAANVGAEYPGVSDWGTKFILAWST